MRTGTSRADDTDRIDPSTVEDQAERVVISFRSPDVDPDDGKWFVGDSAWIVEQMAEPSYRRYLHWAHAGPATVGEEWEEFVNCGCASPQDVVLRVEAVEGGSAIGTETTIEVVPRKELVEAERAAAPSA